jgi:hypothetical protein
MKEIEQKIKTAQQTFKDLLNQLDSTGGLSRERYHRFLNMQYHLTNGVQRHFFALAGNISVGKRKGLRDFLVQFAREEEHHYAVALSDMKELGLSPSQCPLDVKLWWLYFDSIIAEHPFQRLGATCILENIAGTSSDVMNALIGKSDFLNPRNLKFLTIHRHGPNLDHGNQIIEAIKTADLSKDEHADLLIGADIATTMYMRMSCLVANGYNITTDSKNQSSVPKAG